MKINSLKLENYRCFEELAVDFDERLTVIVGANGTGKTTVLDSLAAILEQIMLPRGVGFRQSASASYLKVKDIRSTAMGGFHESARIEINTRILEENGHQLITLKPKLETDLESKGQLSNMKQPPELANVHAKIIKDPAANLELPVFAYYRSTRNLQSVAGVKNKLNNQFNRLQVYQSAANAYANYDQVVSWLYDIFVEGFFDKESGSGNTIREDKFENSERQHISRAVSRMIPEVNEITFTSKSPRKLLLKWQTPDGIEDRLVSQLSDGYRNLLALVMDFARRLVQANPQMDNPLNAKAVLLIDEIELHLHPAWQQKIIRDLQNTFPNTQIICSTHSPQVVSTVQPEKLRILSENKLVSADYKHTYGVSSAIILNDIFGIASYPEIDEIEKLKQKWMALISSNEYDSTESMNLQEKLEGWLGTDSDFIVNCRIDIAKRKSGGK